MIIMLMMMMWVTIIIRQAAKTPYTIPETKNYNVWAEPSQRNFMRKAGFDFGWDW